MVEMAQLVDEIVSENPNSCQDTGTAKPWKTTYRRRPILGALAHGIAEQEACQYMRRQRCVSCAGLVALEMQNQQGHVIVLGVAVAKCLDGVQ